MDKYSVVQDRDKISSTVRTCPKCGGPLEKTSSVSKCLKCGTGPFEKKDSGPSSS